MSFESGLVLLEVKDIKEGLKTLTKNSKYLDGLALKLSDDVLGRVKEFAGTEELRGLKALLLMGALSSHAEEVNQFAHAFKDTEILVMASNDEEVIKIKELTSLDNIKVGVAVNRPAINLSTYSRRGVDFLIMPPMLVRGRVLSESRARKVRIIARPVNDVAICVKLLEGGVYGIVTMVPTLKREAMKLLKR